MVRIERVTEFLNVFLYQFRHWRADRTNTRRIGQTDSAKSPSHDLGTITIAATPTTMISAVVCNTVDNCEARYIIVASVVVLVVVVVVVRRNRSSLCGC